MGKLFLDKSQGYGNASLSDDELLDSITKVAKGGYNEVIKKLAAKGKFFRELSPIQFGTFGGCSCQWNDKLVDDLFAMQIDPDCAL